MLCLEHGKCIIAELRTLTETGNAIRNILTRNGFSLTHSISPPIYGLQWLLFATIVE